MPAIIPIVVVLLLVTSAGVGIPAAVDQFAGENIDPENAIYGIERFGEQIKVGLGMLKHKTLAQERIRELNRIGDINLIEGLLKDIDNEIEASAKYDGEDIQLEDVLQQRTQVLTQLRERVPEAARHGIDTALEAPLRGMIQKQINAQERNENQEV